MSETCWKLQKTKEEEKWPSYNVVMSPVNEMNAVFSSCMRHLILVIHGSWSMQW